jgi:protein SCO1/2
MSIRGIVLLLLFSVILFSVSIYSLFYLDPGNKAKAIEKSTTTPINVGGDFSLIDTNGHLVNQEILKGHYSLIYFGYSYCPDICPTTLSKISEVFKTMPETSLAKIKGYFITLDPKRDNIQQLSDFMKSFHPSIQGLTGDSEQIEKISEDYKIYSQKSEETDSEHYLIDHTSLIYIMDQNGRCIKFFPNDLPPAEIVLELNKLLK